MKKIITAIVFVFLLGSFAQAATIRENCGCGLGTMLLADSDGDSVLIQLVATFLNGTFGNQTFGISSGSLGCEKPSRIAKTERMNIFVADNMDNLAIDIASGYGESLDALAEIAEITTDNRSTFYAALQQNFDTIFAGEQVTHKGVVSKINQIIETI
ncbi:MAG: hypothetical protein CSA22_04425 [Deltaproteobacteria bacterium]|nr:MAG: hypothetical protein CSA22_04425 [Deltaproteobacteria bacterium]